ncbi:MAG: queC [Phycisphaerales bacterium]|nr:queC [Phycisphaerales bacterium]
MTLPARRGRYRRPRGLIPGGGGRTAGLSREPRVRSAGWDECTTGLPVSGPNRRSRRAAEDLVGPPFGGMGVPAHARAGTREWVRRSSVRPDAGLSTGGTPVPRGRSPYNAAMTPDAAPAAPPRPAIVLASGGLDSTTCLAIAKADGYGPVYTMAFDYGQRHRHELAAAERVARHYGVAEHRVVTIDLRQFGRSALTDDALAVPKNRDEAAMAAGVPVTYVPARNTIFLSYALAWAEVLKADDVFVGVNALDYSGYPDCRPEYVAAFQAMARLGTERTNFTVRAPLVHLSKAEIIRLGTGLGIDYGMTHSCYDPIVRGAGSDADVLACGRCDSCLLRKKGFAEAGVPDPTRYA